MVLKKIVLCFLRRCLWLHDAWTRIVWLNALLNSEQMIGELQENINIYEQDMAMLREQMRVREAEYEEDILKIKQQLTQGQR